MEFSKIRDLSFEQAVELMFQKLGDWKIMALATAVDQHVMVRNVSCLFYDGKVHKIGAVDVEKFPKDRFMEEWKIISEDGRFNMTMMPTFDNHTDVDFKIGRMNCHQIYGLWNGNVILDDGTKLEIKDLFAFCEYVENRW